MAKAGSMLKFPKPTLILPEKKKKLCGNSRYKKAGLKVTLPRIRILQILEGNKQRQYEC